MRRLAENFYVAGQMKPDDVGAAAAVGVKHVVNNRPDGEALGQPASDAIKKACDAAGLDYRYAPISGGVFPAWAIADLRDCIATQEPVLAFCRSGARSTRLWALTQVGSLSIDDIVNIAAAAGYDLSDFRDALENQAANNGKENHG